MNSCPEIRVSKTGRQVKLDRFRYSLPYKALIRDYLIAGKFGITTLVTLTAVAGFLLAGGPVSILLIAAMTGVFCLSFGSSMLNQIQEQHLDAGMIRTCSRPLPNGRISNIHAMVCALSSIVSGLLLLLYCGMVPALFGVLAVVFYNLVYTYLKRVTAFAVIPGLVSGALPVAIGWASAGGHLSDRSFIALAVFFVIWQIPHFWLLHFIWGDDYRRVRLPNLTDYFTRSQFSRISFSWVFATGLSGLMLPLFCNFGIKPIHWFLLPVSIWLVSSAFRGLLCEQENQKYKLIFRNVTMYVLIVMVILVIGNYEGIFPSLIHF